MTHPCRRALAAALFLLLSSAPGAWAAEGATAKGSGAATHYLAFPGITASVLAPSGRRAVLAMDASLDIPDPVLRARADSLAPRLRAAFAQMLNVYAGGLGPGRPIDPDYISHEMQRQADQVIGKPGAKFLIGSILVN